MNLEQWLTRATRCLSAESKAKVRAEIEEHYRTALQEPGEAPRHLRGIEHPG